MMRLREVDGQATPEQNEGSIKLDEQTISREDLDSKMNDKSVRIVEVGQGEYKTLHRLKG